MYISKHYVCINWTHNTSVYNEGDKKVKYQHNTNTRPTNAKQCIYKAILKLAYMLITVLTPTVAIFKLKWNIYNIVV